MRFGRCEISRGRIQHFPGKQETCCKWKSIDFIDQKKKKKKEGKNKHRMAGRHDRLFKILILGESGVGKSCLLLRYADDSFSESFLSTVGVDFRVRTLQVDGKTIKLQIWDTAGQEKFRTITQAYYANCHGIALVYDVTDRGSFGSIEHWLVEIKARAPEQVSLILVGNKVDASSADTSETIRQVSTAEGQALAEQHQIPFLETSAKNGINVDAVFMTLVQDLAQRGMLPVPTVPPPMAPNKPACCR